MTDAEIMTKDHWALIKGVLTLVYTPYATKAEVIAAVEKKPTHEKWTIIQATSMTVKTSIEYTIPITRNG